ncbi:carboxypeptidase T precursor [unidentified eubacterium SCB49]|nr:carboxypeptidase T precursor [unidentified eubacterium SCB49]
MKKAFLFICTVLLSTSLFAQEVQEQYQRAKIFYSQASELQALEEMGIPVEHGVQKANVFIISDFSVSELAKARQAGYQVEILIEDSKAHFISENKKNTPARNLSCVVNDQYDVPTNFNLGTMGGYLTYQEILDELDAMKAAYPNLITTKANIGNFLTEGQPDNSVTPSIGGNGIKWVKISDNPDVDETEEEIFYSAIHHAREPMSVMQLIYYMWYLLENYETDTEVQNIVDNTELYFVPIVNPDGYLYNEKTDPNGGGFWRKNRKNNGGGSFGVDNNRNYDYFIDGDANNGAWGGEGASTNPNNETYRGSDAFSEVENQAIKWFCEQHDFVMAFNNHSYGNLLLYPFGYEENELTEDNDLFVAIGDELVSKNGFNNMISSGLYPASGDSDDFMYGTVGTHDKIYAYTPEIGPDFWPNSSQIIPISQSMMYFNLTSSKMVNNFANLTDNSPQFIGNEGVNDAAFTIRRLGVTGDGSFTVTLEPVSTNITAQGNAVNFTTLDLLESQDGNIQYTLAAGTVAGEQVVFDLVVNNGSYDTKTRVTKYFGELNTIFSDQGDSATDNFDNEGWATTTQTFVSPSTSITDSPNTEYQNGANEIITLNEPIDLTDATGANVTFYAKWEIETGWDYVQFEISIDNGNSWIPQCGNYTTTGNDNGFQPSGEPLYDGTQNDWVLEEISLSDYIGETILARFQLESDNAQRADGFYFDDLTFNVLGSDVLEVNEIENTFGIYPNPVKDQLNITTAMNNYDIAVYTVQGQLISEIKNQNGSQKIDYSHFSNGIYVMTLQSEGSSTSFKIIKN